MANEGEWRTVLDFLSEAIARQTGIRDYIGGEKVIQGFLAAFLSVADYYVFRSEAELGKGHADICLEPLVARYPHLQRGYLIELSTLIAVGACSAFRPERQGRTDPPAGRYRRSALRCNRLAHVPELRGRDRRGIPRGRTLRLPASRRRAGLDGSLDEPDPACG